MGDAALIHGKLFVVFYPATKDGSFKLLYKESPWWWWTVHQRQFGFFWLFRARKWETGILLSLL